MRSFVLRRQEQAVLPLTIVDQTQNPFHPLIWKSLLLFGVVVYGSFGVLMNLCEVDHKIPFSSSSVVLMIEVTKLLVSFGLTVINFKDRIPFEQLSFYIVLPFGLPAVLYCVNNNIAVHMQIQMDPATYQILSNLKILTTALLYKMIIRRPITVVQWFSLVLLTVAGVSHSYGSLKDEGDKTPGIFITWQGIAMMSLYCTFSGLAGVYSEYILKKQHHLSLAMQNLVLYIYGVVLNGLLYISSNDATKQGFFAGYSAWTWVIVATQAANGLIISVIMKHSSNITRLFVISSAIIVSTGLSMSVLSLQPNFYLIVACLLVLFALILYHKDGNIAQKKIEGNVRQL